MYVLLNNKENNKKEEEEVKQNSYQIKSETQSTIIIINSNIK